MLRKGELQLIGMTGDILLSADHALPLWWISFLAAREYLEHGLAYYDGHIQDHGWHAYYPSRTC
jgi:hypothetical protein